MPNSLYFKYITYFNNISYNKKKKYFCKFVLHTKFGLTFYIIYNLYKARLHYYFYVFCYALIYILNIYASTNCYI